MQRLAIIGAGPIGLEAALEGARRGYEVRVYEAGEIGAHLRRFGWLPLFTPFAMNSTELGRRRLRESGVALPGDGDLLTADELVDRYLLPLSRLPELRDSVRERSRVAHIAREGSRKTGGIVAAGDSSREGRPFLLQVEETHRTGPPRGTPAVRVEIADVVIDASGVYWKGRFTGPGGMPAIGEIEMGDRISRHIPALRGIDADRFAGARVLLVGDGHSAATVLAEWGAVAARNPKEAPARVHWVHPPASGAGPVFEEVPSDPLPARSALASSANRVARSATWITAHPGAIVERYDAAPGGGLRVSLRDAGGATRDLDVDRVLALVGYRPDTDIFRELQVHLCYASEAPMALAAAILTASLADPSRAGDCLAQVSHGPETLKNPEPDFYVLGAKSYGRNANFLLTIGHQQILDAFSLMAASETARTAARTTAASS